MKTIKLTVLLLISLLLMNSCNSDTIDEQKTGYPGGYSYAGLHLSFLDTSGNDLLKGLGFTLHDGIPVVKPHLFTLETILPDERMRPYLGPLTDPFAGFRHQPLICARTGERLEWCPPPSLRPILRISAPRPNAVIKENYHLSFTFSTPMFDVDWNPVPPANKITIMLTLPHIFGDDVAREIVTHWRPHPIPEELYSLLYFSEAFPYLWYHYCYRIEFEGKEIVAQPILRHSSSNAIITVGATIVLGDV